MHMKRWSIDAYTLLDIDDDDSDGSSSGGGSRCVEYTVAGGLTDLPTSTKTFSILLSLMTAL
jgi:hypothetical protein